MSHRGFRALTRDVRKLMAGMGADLVGIAPVDRFEGAPPGHHPRDWLAGCRSVVVVAIRQLEAAHDWPWMMAGTPFATDDNRLAILQEYWYAVVNHDVHDALLDQMALRLALHLQRLGHASLFHEAGFFPALYPLLHARLSDPPRGLFSHRHAAVRAGLGEFGLNNLVVTPQYGPYVRFVSVLTEADLVPDPVPTKKVCLGARCGLCLELCEGDVLRREPGASRSAFWLDPPVRTDRARCMDRRREEFCRGQCLARCPVGAPLRAVRKRLGVQREGGKPARGLALRQLAGLERPATSRLTRRSTTGGTRAARARPT